MKKRLLLVMVVAVLVAGLSAGAQGLTGTWDFNAFFIHVQTQPLVLDSTLTLTYSFDDWAMWSESVFTINGFESQAFVADGYLGAFSANAGILFSSIDFLGLIPSLPLQYAHSWIGGSVSMAGVDFSLSADHFRFPWGFLEWPCSPQTGDYVLLTAAGSSEPFSAVVTFDQCGCGGVCFNDVKFGVMGLSYCGADFGAITSFSCSGFEGISFTFEGIGFPALSWVSFDLEFFFTTQTDTQKTLTITPVINLEAATCLTIWAELEQTGGLTIGGLSIYGIGIDASWNGVSFYSVSSLDPSRNEDVTGDSAYWEMFTISAEGDACCGGVSDFSVSTYFLSGSTYLFDWGATSAMLEFGVASNFRLRASVDITVNGLIGFGLGWTLDF